MQCILTVTVNSFGCRALPISYICTIDIRHGWITYAPMYDIVCIKGVIPSLHHIQHLQVAASSTLSNLLSTCVERKVHKLNTNVHTQQNLYILPKKGVLNQCQ